jgi:hypothetical protein
MMPDKDKIIKETVHKTIAAVKIKCKRVTYPDGQGIKEIFMIEAKDLDEIEKELSKRC